MGAQAEERTAAVDALDAVARALKRQHEATKWALQEVRRAQAALVGIAVDAPTPQIHAAQQALADVQVNTRPREGGRSVPTPEEDRPAQAAG